MRLHSCCCAYIFAFRSWLMFKQTLIRNPNPLKKNHSFNPGKTNKSDISQLLFFCFPILWRKLLSKEKLALKSANIFWKTETYKIKIFKKTSTWKNGSFFLLKTCFLFIQKQIDSKGTNIYNSYSITDELFLY